jgi:hypothetical protein
MNKENNDIVDIVALVQNNPLFNLNGEYGSKVIEKIKNRFNEEEIRIYVTNLYCYLNYDKKHFVILLEKIYKWLGYNRLNDCKAVLVKHFKEGTDYKIENFATENSVAKNETIGDDEKNEKNKKNETRGGHNKENILLTINCFKKLCLKSRTDQADKIHDYYINLEEILNETIIEQSKELEQKLLVEKEKNYKLTGKKIRTHSKGHFIYIYSPHPNEDIHKIGTTINLDERESTFMCSNPFGRLVYERFCPGSHIVEKTIHLMFDKYRVTNNREHFKGSLDFFTKKIDELIDTIDIKESNEINEVKESSEVKESNKKLIQNKVDIQQFINERCESGDAYYCIKKEIPAAYKIWSKSNNKYNLKSVQNYFDSNFKKGKKFFENYNNSTLSVYNGIRLKPVEINENNKHAKFLSEHCKFGPLNRVDTKTIIENYKKYRKQNISLNEISEFKKYLNNHEYIFNNYVALNTHHIDGYWGIQLKENDVNYGVKVSKSRRKNVVCRNENGEILEFESLTLASRHFNIGIPEITLDIKLNRVRNGYTITSNDIKIPEHTFQKEIPEQNFNGVSVYKYDTDHNLIIEYPSITVAAKIEKIGEETIRKYSKTEKIKNGFYWSRNKIHT